MLKGVESKSLLVFTEATAVAFIDGLVDDVVVVPVLEIVVQLVIAEALSLLSVEVGVVAVVVAEVVVMLEEDEFVEGEVVLIFSLKVGKFAEDVFELLTELVVLILAAVVFLVIVVVAVVAFSAAAVLEVVVLAKLI